MFVVVPLVVVVAAALYAFGLQRGRAQLETQRADFEGRLASVEQARSAAEQRLAVMRNILSLREAETTLLRAGVELDRRNFGLANDRLRAASEALGRIVDPAGGVSLQQLAALRDDIDRLDINVAVNLEQQRGEVLALADRLGALVPAARDASVTAEPAPSPAAPDAPSPGASASPADH